jgi:hypothetical protein
MEMLKRSEPRALDRVVNAIVLSAVAVGLPFFVACATYPETPEDCFLKQVQAGTSPEAAKLIKLSCEERYRKSAFRLDAEEVAGLSATAAVILTNAELHIKNSNDDIDVTEVLVDVPGGLAEGIRIPVSIAPRGEIRQTTELDGGAAKRKFDHRPKELLNMKGVGLLLVPYESTQEDQVRAIIESHPHYYDREVRVATIREAYGVRRR